MVKMVCLIFHLLFLFSLGVVTGEKGEETIKKLGTLDLNSINGIPTKPNERKPLTRKLYVDPFPARPTPLPEISEPPLHSSVGFSVPANVVRSPHPPQPLAASPPPLQLPSPLPQTPSPPSLQLPSPLPQTPSPPPPPPPHKPSLPPMSSTPAPENPPFDDQAPAPQMSFTPAPENPPPFADDSSPPPSPFTLPPCKPIHHEAPALAPETAVHNNKLWCVAKPTVPSDTLQVAMDYACGDGGADCKAIMPDGNCYTPDSVVAHASYAFNSYWQKNKKTGGTCGFDGTAMLINNDPSYLQCRFVLA